MSAPIGFRSLLPWLAVLAILPALVPGLAYADAGPKMSTSVTVRVVEQGRPISFDRFDAELVSCGATGTPNPSAPNTGRSGPPDPTNPYRFVGSGTQAQPAVTFGSTYFNSPPWCLRVAVRVPATGQLYVTSSFDRTRRNEFLTVDLRPDGSALITQDRLLPWDEDWRLEMVLIALPLTLVVELAIVILWSRRQKFRPARAADATSAASPGGQPALAVAPGVMTKAPPTLRRLLVVGFVANFLTLPGVWLIAGLAGGMSTALAGVIALGVLELFAFLFEGLLYWRPGHLGFGSAMALSLLANFASFVIGALVH